MSAADEFDDVVARAGRTTASATQVYRRQMAVLGERVRIRAQDDRHRRGVTRESVERGGAILLPADDADLSPHSPISGSAAIIDIADGAETQPTVPEHLPATEKPSADSAVADSSYQNGWLTDR